MKRIKLAIIVLVASVAVIFSLVSCENQLEDTNVMKASELEASVNELNTTQSDGHLQTRGGITFYTTPSIGNYTPNSSENVPI